MHDEQPHEQVLASHRHGYIRSAGAEGDDHEDAAEGDDPEDAAASGPTLEDNVDLQIELAMRNTAPIMLPKGQAAAGAGAGDTPLGTPSEIATAASVVAAAAEAGAAAGKAGEAAADYTRARNSLPNALLGWMPCRNGAGAPEPTPTETTFLKFGSFEIWTATCFKSDLASKILVLDNF